LANARDALVEKSLIERVFSGNEPREIRKQLISDIAGIGPKQASMFLRNTGISYDLAILDTHVLHYLNIKKVLSQEQMKIGTLSAYEKTESIVVQYADSLGYPVGYLDWAIWATMRAAMELSL
jgi:N-glycosylase/DNA lyase